MTTPEPLDEHPAGEPETRGGDRLADITVRPPLSDELLAAVRAHEAVCDCDDGTPE